MDRESFNHWLASYGNAWTSRDPEAAASLYADDATYLVTPFDEPLCGRAAMYEYWAGVAKPKKISSLVTKFSRARRSTVSPGGGRPLSACHPAWKRNWMASF
jgi:ketosteroid isomerase-like protein